MLLKDKEETLSNEDLQDTKPLENPDNEQRSNAALDDGDDGGPNPSQPPPGKGKP